MEILQTKSASKVIRGVIYSTAQNAGSVQGIGLDRCRRYGTVINLILIAINKIYIIICTYLLVAQISSLTESVNHGHMYSVQFYWPVYLVFIKVHCYWWCSPIAYDMQSFLLYCNGEGLSKWSNSLSVTANLIVLFFDSQWY